MPRVSLTAEQKKQYEIDTFCSQVLDALNAERTARGKSGNAFADEIGISKSSWSRWNNRNLGNTDLEMFLKALYLAGFRVLIEKNIPFRHYREQAGLTQEELSEITGIPQNSISQYETGARKPSEKALKKIEDALGFSIEKEDF